MANRLKSILTDFFQQADLVLLALCCVSTLYGIVLIFSATQYMENGRWLRYVAYRERPWSSASAPTSSCLCWTWKM